MKINIHSTPVFTTINGVPARIWEGTTETGTPVIAFITRVAVPADATEREHAQFAAELEEHEAPSIDARGWPAMLLHNAPVVTCSHCGRRTAVLGRSGQYCGMTQPDGSDCLGTFGAI